MFLHCKVGACGPRRFCCTSFYPTDQQDLSTKPACLHRSIGTFRLEVYSTDQYVAGKHQFGFVCVHHDRDEVSV